MKRTPPGAVLPPSLIEDDVQNDDQQVHNPASLPRERRTACAFFCGLLAGL